MTIECYFGGCRYHESNDGTPDSGPFCHEAECRATVDELAKFEQARERQVKDFRIQANTLELHRLKDKLQDNIGELCAIFENDTGLTICNDGVYLEREPATIGQKRGAIINASVEVVL